MKTIDLNADIGEAEDTDSIASELAILQFVSSANIACGGHRGDTTSMRRTIAAALDNDVQIGAHPAYPDRENFGRKSMALGVDISEDALAKTLTDQIKTLINITATQGAQVSYVKPHGALYNDSVKSAPHADLIARVIKDIHPALGFMGAPNSEMGLAANKHGLRFISEGFIDRRYTDDGHLQSRQIDGAVIESHDARMQQARNLVTIGEVTTASGKSFAIICESLCLHGDSEGAVQTAKAARAVIEDAGVTICAPNLSPLNLNER